MMMHIMSKRALCAVAVLIACGSSAFGAVSPRESLSGTLRQLGVTNPLKPDKSIKDPEDLKKFAQKLLRGKRATSPTRASSAVSPQALTKVLRDMGKTPLYREIRSIQEFKKFAQAPMGWLRAGVLAHQEQMHQEQVRREAEAIAQAEAERLRQAAQPSDISLMNFTPLADPRPTPENLIEFSPESQPESLLDFGPEATKPPEHLSMEEMRAWALRQGGNDQPRSLDTEDPEALERAHKARTEGEIRARKEAKREAKRIKAEQEAAEVARKAQEKALKKARKEADRVAREAEQKQREEQERANEREEERRRLEEENREAQQRREQAAAEEQRQKEQEARRKQETRARKQEEARLKREEVERKQQAAEQKRLRKEEERKVREAEEARKREEEARIKAEEELRKAEEERQRAQEAEIAAIRAAEEQQRLEQLARERTEEERLRAERQAEADEAYRVYDAAQISLEELQRVLAAGNRINARTILNDTALHRAARELKPDAVQNLLRAGANPALFNNDNKLPRNEAEGLILPSREQSENAARCRELIDAAEIEWRQRSTSSSSSGAASPVRPRSGSFDASLMSSSGSTPERPSSSTSSQSSVWNSIELPQTDRLVLPRPNRSVEKQKRRAPTRKNAAQRELERKQQEALRGRSAGTEPSASASFSGTQSDRSEEISATESFPPPRPSMSGRGATPAMPVFDPAAALSRLRKTTTGDLPKPAAE